MGNGRHRWGWEEATMFGFYFVGNGILLKMFDVGKEITQPVFTNDRETFCKTWDIVGADC